MKLVLSATLLLLAMACNQTSKYKSTTTMQNNQLQKQAVNWLPASTVYEINVRQYTPEGTFAAFATHIPRLKKMGITTLWFMPIHPIGKLNRKETLGSYYSISDYKGINPEFGTLQDFKNLVKLAHDNNMKLIIDWVANHSSWDNPWVTQHPEYYAKDSTSGKMYAPFDWSDVVQFDHNNAAQQQAMIDAMQYWVTECNIDGFRCDMAHLTPLKFWEQARLQCDSIKPLYWLAESQDVPYYTAFDVLYGWEWLHKMEDYYKGKTDIAGLDSVITKYNEDYKHGLYRILFTSNHDENSWQDTEYKRYGAAAKTFAVLCATLPGIPLVYSGQEEPLQKKLNFFNKDDIGFNKYELNAFYTALLSERTNNPALQADSTVQFFRLSTSANQSIYAFVRKKDKKEIFILCNLSNLEQKFSVLDNRLTGIFSNIQNGEKSDFTSQKYFAIEPWGYVVYNK